MQSISSGDAWLFNFSILFVYSRVIKLFMESPQTILITIR